MKSMGNAKPVRAAPAHEQAATIDRPDAIGGAGRIEGIEPRDGCVVAQAQGCVTQVACAPHQVRGRGDPLRAVMGLAEERNE